MILYILIFIFYTLTVLFCIQEGQSRKIGIVKALLACFLFTPLIGYFIVNSSPKRNAVGCRWCGNEDNEAEFCGVCRKNEKGETKA